MLFQAHDQRMHPGVEEHIGTFETHLGGIAGGEVLDMHRRGDDRAANAEALGDVALHLRAQHQLRRGVDDRLLDIQIIVGDQRSTP
jgi:hypothetical protein